MRKFMNIMESGFERGEDGRVVHDNVSYTVDTTKVIAHLKSHNSAQYTRLATKLQRVKDLSDEVKKLKEEITLDTKEHVADLFSADDVVRTRVVDTCSVIFTLTKDPKETITPKYKNILEALTEDFTPELMERLEFLKKTMVTVTQKAPALSHAVKSELTEGVLDGMMSLFRKIKAAFASWGAKYDNKLDSIKAQLGLSEDVNLQESFNSWSSSFTTVWYDENIDDDDEDAEYEVEVEVSFTVSGEYYPATRWEPEEHPDLEVHSVTRSSTGEDIMNLLSPKELQSIEEEAWEVYQNETSAARDDYEMDRYIRSREDY